MKMYLNSYLTLSICVLFFVPGCSSSTNSDCKKIETLYKTARSEIPADEKFLDRSIGIKFDNYIFENELLFKDILIREKVQEFNQAGGNRDNRDKFVTQISMYCETNNAKIDFTGYEFRTYS